MPGIDLHGLCPDDGPVLPPQVTYTPLSRKEVELVENAMRHGAEHALRQRSVQQGISPAVRELIRTGVVQLTLHNVHSKTLVSKLRTPHV